MFSKADASGVRLEDFLRSVAHCKKRDEFLAIAGRFNLPPIYGTFAWSQYKMRIRQFAKKFTGKNKKRRASHKGTSAHDPFLPITGKR